MKRNFDEAHDSVQDFYAQLGSKGLAALTSEANTKSVLRFLIPYLSKNCTILDVACGYGRLTIPLAKRGYRLEGIDITPNLIASARRDAQRAGMRLSFTVGDMRALPYRDTSFDVLVCMWSSFNHLLTIQDQVHTLKEMMRVLNDDGIAIIDMPYFNGPTKTLRKHGAFLDKACHLYQRIFDGIENVVFLHDKKTMASALKKAGITSYKLTYDIIAGKRRLVLVARKK